MKLKSLYSILWLWGFQAAILGIVFSWLYITQTSTNHGFAYTPFTPLSVSDDLIWWQPGCVFVLFLGTTLFFRKVAKWSWGYSALIAALWTIPFPAFMFWTRFQTPPPPTRLTPVLTYWGWGLSWPAAAEFIRGNILVFLFFITYPIFVYRSNRTAANASGDSGNPENATKTAPHRLKWTILLPICFLISISPFLIMKAGVYGYVGHYVDYDCERQLSDLHSALLLYAQDHENRLPIAGNYEELYPQIRPYLPNSDHGGIRERYDACIIGLTLDRPAMPFIWNKKFSGKEVIFDRSLRYYFDSKRQIEQSNPAFTLFSDGIYEISGEKWISCPYRIERKRQNNIAPIQLPLEKFSPEKFNIFPPPKEKPPEPAFSILL